MPSSSGEVLSCCWTEFAGAPQPQLFTSTSPCTHAEFWGPMAAMQQRTSPPGAEFYYERLARARAVPEAERSADVRQWLQQHEELEAALAALPRCLPAPPHSARWWSPSAAMQRWRACCATSQLRTQNLLTCCTPRPRCGAFTLSCRPSSECGGRPATRREQQQAGASYIHDFTAGVKGPTMIVCLFSHVGAHAGVEAKQRLFQKGAGTVPLSAGRTGT